MSKCLGLKPDGTECSAPPVGQGDYCYMHAPDLKSQADEARFRGGKARRAVPLGEFPGSISNVGELMRFINLSLVEAWGLESGERRIRAVTSLLRICIDAINLSDIDKRLATLENLFYKEGLDGKYQNSKN